MIRTAIAADASAIADIYNHYIRETTVTFEEDPLTSAEMSRRMADVVAASLPWLVATVGPRVTGYAYATKWRVRSAYRHSTEITVYLAPDCTGRGLGSELYARLFPMLESSGIHAVIGGIALPNAASVALHQKFGMRQVAHFEQVGFKQNRWVDVGYWQRLLPSIPPREDQQI